MQPLKRGELFPPELSRRERDGRVFQVTKRGLYPHWNPKARSKISQSSVRARGKADSHIKSTEGKGGGG